MIMSLISNSKISGRTTTKKHHEKGRQPTMRRIRSFGRFLRLEHLEDRAMLSISAGIDANLSMLAANLNNFGTNNTATVASTGSLQLVAAPNTLATVAQTALFYGNFNTIIPIPEATPTWVGYDINTSSLPAGAVITQIILHHNVDHTQVSDLQVKLYNDSGREWLIRQNSGTWIMNFNEFKTDTNVFAGALANQPLHYRVRDTVANGKTGSLQMMELWITYQIPATAPDLTVTSSHAGNFIQGQSGATYTIAVANSGSASTSGLVSVKDVLPAGLTATAISGAGWTTNLGALSATRSDALAPGSSYAPITVTVKVANNAPANVVNTVQVSGGVDLKTGNNTANDPTTITQFPDLTITGTHAGNFVPGQIGATYTITVTNSGSGSTSGLVSVQDVLPAGLTATAISGAGWATNLGTLSATRSNSLAPGASYAPIIVTVNVANNAPASLTNTVQVSGGGEVNTSNNTANDPTTIIQLPDLTITGTHTGNFVPGQIGATYTITVTNSGSGSTSGLVSVQDRKSVV
jgi:uncharacterized repeat protein (TIGR01451 family)